MKESKLKENLNKDEDDSIEKDECICKNHRVYLNVKRKDKKVKNEIQDYDLELKYELHSLKNEHKEKKKELEEL